ncbi:MAG: DUF4129 domain-containing protein [Candidatus Acidiferrum sp.]
MLIKRILFCALLLLYPWRLSQAWAPGQRSVPPAPAASAAPYDAASFIAELHRLSGLLEKKTAPQTVSDLRQSLPEQWVVETPDRSYSIPTDFLRNKLSTGQLDAAKEWLNHLASETESYSARSTAPQAGARSQLDHILAQGEFSAVRPPTPWELFRQRVGAWLKRMVLKLVRGLQGYPVGGEILFWLLIVAAVTFIAFWIFRFVTHFDRMNTMAPARFVAPSRSWQEWLRAARQAADRGESREAVHAAYWAGIVRLQEIGALPKDRSKTPREYLRIATQPSPSGIAPNPSYREPLAGLTTRLERIWYANRNPGANDFRDSLLQLEALGCRLE